ncbi:MAG: (2Fe-2S)-binding protein [Acidobacteria bacterium]|nr:(2Fe-2S)-binding protein [Acidobacteriota bacterium]
MSEEKQVILKKKVVIKINGKDCEREVEPRMLLVDFLRDELGLTGTHIGCDTSNCGACTVLLDGRSIKSCTFLAVAADGRQVKTVEGLAEDGKLHPIQEAFWEHHGLQCGYCTSGMLMSALHLLSHNPSPTDYQVRRGIAGNLCRCTGYQFIVDSVKDAAKRMKATR